MDDLVAEFVTETMESLSVLDQELVRFEQAPKDSELLGNIFRMMHTIKGTCGFLGLPRLEKVAHAGEDVLGRFRDGALEPTPQSVTLILKCIDQIRSIVDSLAAGGGEGNGDDSQLIAELKAILDAKADAAPVQSPAAVPVAAGVIAEVQHAEAPVHIAPEGFPVAADFLAEFNLAVAAAESVAEPAAKPAVTEVIAAPTEAARVETKIEPAKERSESGKEKAAPQTIRVNVEVLENLMTLVSEMVLTRNQLLQLTKSSDDSVFKDPIERLSRSTSELQEGVMKTRMQPIGNAWSKLPRIVRDLANELGKKINLVMVGEETELDRQVLELIQDPLTHMVRNSADHGLEGPDDRVSAGKDPTGTVRLSAFHEGGHIIIEISDDGRGINTAKIRAKIVERGLATAEEVAAMDDASVDQYIMRAGFSTAEKVTKVSGRGVGMDVVRANIEKIGGTVEFRSIFGQGSTFKIKIPLTLAIISSLIVESGQQRFALPQISVNEVVRISERSDHRIESLKGAPILRLRNRLLPLISLAEHLNLGDKENRWHPARNTYEGYVVVCHNGNQAMGIIVDRISDAEEIVVKPLSKILGAAKFFSGNTILGDGRVILILDVNGLSSTLAQDTVQAQLQEKNQIEAVVANDSILLFRTIAEGLRAVPLSNVQRIESVDMTTTEVVQGEIVIQYRDCLLPIFCLDGESGIRREGRQQILVFGGGAQSVGLAIEAIIDIVEDNIVLQKRSHTAGLLGSAIIAGRAVDVLDTAYLLNRAAESRGDVALGAAA